MANEDGEWRTDESGPKATGPAASVMSPVVPVGHAFP
jgi:hypothetical protein